MTGLCQYRNTPKHEAMLQLNSGKLGCLAEVDFHNVTTAKKLIDAGCLPRLSSLEDGHPPPQKGGYIKLSFVEMGACPTSPELIFVFQADGPSFLRK
jgi:hypothetical protein